MSVDLDSVSVTLGFIDVTQSKLAILVFVNPYVTSVVNISIAGVISIPGQNSTLARIHSDGDRLSLTGGNLTLEWTFRMGDSSRDADACWVGDASTIDSSRWTQGTDFVYNGTNAGMAIAWLNREIFFDTYFEFTVELLEETGEVPSLSSSLPPEQITYTRTASFVPSTSPSRGRTASFTAPLIPIHFTIRRLLRMLYPLTVLG